MTYNELMKNNYCCPLCNTGMVVTLDNKTAICLNKKCSLSKGYKLNKEKETLNKKQVL
jgi:hypothetical protein